MIKRLGFIVILVAVVLQVRIATADNAALVRSSDADATVGIKDVTVGSTSVSGTIINKSSNSLREVHLVLRQEFRWKDEMNPGEASPGRVRAYTYDGPLAPNSSTEFKFDFDPLPERSDGHFANSIEVTGFTTVEP